MRTQKYQMDKTLRNGYLLASFLMAFLLCTSVMAADGDLDTTFNDDGIVITDLNSGSDDFSSAVIIQTDGKIVVAGNSDNGVNSDFAVVRYNIDGSLDTSFNGDGIVTTDISGYDDWCYGAAIQPDGKILVSGTANSEFAVVRYNIDGSLDTSFDGDGMVTTALGGGNHYYATVAIQSDGKIVAAGTVYVSGYNCNVGVVRYNADGSLDTTFDGDGMVTTDFGSGGDDRGCVVAIQSDGKIIVAGYSGSISNYDFAVVRYNIDGSLDTSFAGDGMETTAIGSENDYGRAMAIQPDGKIIVAGQVNTPSADFGVVRYNVDGSLDTSFSDDGKVQTSIGFTDVPYGAAIQADGKIVVAGYNQFTVVRYNTDGSLDNSFSDDGMEITMGINSQSAWGHAVAIQPDGKIVVAGESSDGQFDLTVIRYEATAPGEACELPPMPIFPENGAVDLSLIPVLMIEKNIDALTCGTIRKTSWQISETSDFQKLVYNRNVFKGDLLTLQVPPGVLAPNTGYYWRANIHCSSGCKSDYSVTSCFTTGD